MGKVHSAFTYGQYPDALLWDKTASSNAGRMYAALSRYAAQRLRERPGRKELADRLGWSVDTLDRAKRELIARDLLRVEYVFGPGGRQEESDYFLGPFPEGEGRKDAVGGGRTDAAHEGRTDDTPKNLKGKASPNGDGGQATKQDGRADTVVGRCVDALGFRPVEIGAFSKIVNDASDAVSSPEVLLRAVREWGAAGEPVSWLGNRIGTLDREARARRRRGNGVARSVHDGKHEPSCWCWNVPEDQRAKVKRGDLLAAAGITRQESGTIPEGSA